MKRKDIIEFEIGSMEFGGESSTLIGKIKLKMKGGITGQKVKAIVKKARSEKAEVKLLEVMENSPIETEEVCAHFGQCGGCSILSVPYEKQLEIKAEQVLKLFEEQDISGFEFLGISSRGDTIREHLSPFWDLYQKYSVGDKIVKLKGTKEILLIKQNDTLRVRLYYKREEL